MCSLYCSPEWERRETSKHQLQNSLMASSHLSHSDSDGQQQIQQMMPRKRRGRPPKKLQVTYDGDISASDKSFSKSRDYSVGYYHHHHPPAGLRHSLKLAKQAGSASVPPVVRIGRPKMFTDDKVELFESLMRTEKYAPLWDRGNRGEIGQRKIELFEEAAKEVTQLFNQEVTVQQAQRLFTLMKCKKSEETQKFQEQQLQHRRQEMHMSGIESGGEDINEFIPDPSIFVESVLSPNHNRMLNDMPPTNANAGGGASGQQMPNHEQQMPNHIPIPQLKMARHNSGNARYSLPTPSPSPIESNSIDDERLQLERDILRLQKLAAQRQVEYIELQIQQAKELHALKVDSLQHGSGSGGGGVSTKHVNLHNGVATEDD